MRIERVDLRDPLVADAWYDVYERADRHERPYAAPWLREEISEQFIPNLREDSSAYAGFDAGRIVCVGTITLPLLDNTHSVTVDVYTEPSCRRRGLATQMLQHLEGIVRQTGRRVAYLEASYPFEGPADGRGYPGPEFATAHGYTLGLGDIMRLLTLPVPTERLATLARKAAVHHEGYRLETFSGRVPDEWVADYIVLDASVGTDSPRGELEIEMGTTDLESFRETEARQARQGRINYSAVALRGSEVVGYTAVSVPRSQRDRGFQWGTLVAKAHRGHRLGLALKVANLQQIQASEPEMTSVVTWNAEANGPMIDVNDELGFVPVERFAEFQKRW